ncbi:unnamed protein product [Ectocarpus fasciculatus]
MGSPPPTLLPRTKRRKPSKSFKNHTEKLTSEPVVVRPLCVRGAPCDPFEKKRNSSATEYVGVLLYSSLQQQETTNDRYEINQPRMLQPLCRKRKKHAKTLCNGAPYILRTTLSTVIVKRRPPPHVSFSHVSF